MEVALVPPALKTGRRLGYEKGNQVQLVSWLAGIDEKTVRLENLPVPSGHGNMATLYYTYGWPSVEREPSYAGEVPTGVAADIVGQGATVIIVK